MPGLRAISEPFEPYEVKGNRTCYANSSSLSHHWGSRFHPTPPNFDLQDRDAGRFFDRILVMIVCLRPFGCLTAFRSRHDLIPEDFPNPIARSESQWRASMHQMRVRISVRHTHQIQGKLSKLKTAGRTNAGGFA